MWRHHESKNLLRYLTLQLDQLELALPGRDYYLKLSSENEIRAYHKYMTEVAQLLGAKPDTASEELYKVLQLERRLANVSSQNPPACFIFYGAKGKICFLRGNRFTALPCLSSINVESRGREFISNPCPMHIPQIIQIHLSEVRHGQIPALALTR